MICEKLETNNFDIPIMYVITNNENLDGVIVDKLP